MILPYAEAKHDLAYHGSRSETWLLESVRTPDCRSALILQAREHIFLPMPCAQSIFVYSGYRIPRPMSAERGSAASTRRPPSAIASAPQARGKFHSSCHKGPDRSIYHRFRAM